VTRSRRSENRGVLDRTDACWQPGHRGPTWFKSSPPKSIAKFYALGHHRRQLSRRAWKDLVPIPDDGEANRFHASGCRTHWPSALSHRRRVFHGNRPLARASRLDWANEMAPFLAAGGITGAPGAVAIPTGIPRGIPYPHAVSARKRENHPSFQCFNESSEDRYQPRLRPQGGCRLDCPSGSSLFIVPFQVRDSPTTTTALGLRPISIAWRVVEQEPSLHIKEDGQWGEMARGYCKDRWRSARPRLGNPDRRPEAPFRALTIREARSRPRSVRSRCRN
jgi:hypothetical protein